MVRIVMSEPKSEGALRLYRHLSRHNRVQVIGAAYDGVEAAQMALALLPDALVVEEGTAGLSGAEVCSLVSRTAPQVPCVLLAQRADLPTARAAMRAGARVLWAEDEDLSSAVASLQQLVTQVQATGSPDFQRLADPTRMPLAFVGISAKDGQGATTLLAALALQVAREHEGETVLLDWRPQLSDLSTLLGLRPRYSLVDLAPHGADLDPEAISACLVRHDSGLWVLPGMLQPDHVWLRPLTRDFAAQLLGVLRRRFRFVFCDLPTVLGPAELYLARHAQAVLLITSLTDAGAMRSVATLTDLLRAQDFSDERLRVVVTRQDRSNPFSSEDLSNLVHLPVTAAIPEDPSLPRSLRNGESAASRRGPAAAALQDLASTLITHPLSSPAPAPLTAQ